MTVVDPANDPEGTPPPSIDAHAHAELQLENALLRAGVDLDSEHGKLVRDAQAGKEPDVEAIKRQWELVKPKVEAPPAEPPAEPRIEGEGDQGAVRSALAATSAVEPNPADLDPNDEAVRAGQAVLTGARTGTTKDAFATGFHKLAEAAGRGDARVLVRDEPVS